MAGAPQPVKTIGEEFVAHRLLDPLKLPHGMVLPHPLNMQAYVRNVQSNQTQRCAQVAVELYNEQLALKNIPGLTQAQGIHSNMFILSHEDPWSYFHVYLKAYWQKERVYCFAELCGLRGPERLTVIAKLDSHIIGPGRICRFCFGGVRHPSNAEFTGLQPAEGELATDLEMIY